MQGIYIAAIITTLIAVSLIGGFIFGLSRKEERLHLLVAFLLTLPMSALAFHLVRMPLDSWLKGLLVGNPDLLGFLRTFYAPLPRNRPSSGPSSSPGS